MAELTYDDVRRAAQDAVRDLQNIVYGLQNSQAELRRGMQQAANNTYLLNDIMARLNAMQQQLNAVQSAARSPNGQQLPYAMQQSMTDLQRRMAGIEQFVQACYRYFTVQQAKENEEQQYRGIS